MASDDDFMYDSEGDGAGFDDAEGDFEEFEEFDGSSSVNFDEEVEFEDPEMTAEEFNNPPLRRQRSFIVVPESQILTTAEKEIEAIMEILNIPTKAQAALLLRYFEWNREKLISRYAEDPEGTLKAAGLSSLELEAKPKHPKRKMNCPVCYEDVRISKTFALGCGHRFCLKCWKTNLEIKVKEGPSCLSTRCMNNTCKNLVHEEAFKQILGKRTFSLYSKYMLRSYVDDNPMVKWCPAPGCENCIRCERKNRKEPVCCNCGFEFCFRCADFEIGNHQPASCSSVEKWLQKASDESENVNWLEANTKKCPKCRAPIEKNGGCMHMTCTKNAGGCGFEFCWLCRGPWSEHGSHTGGYYSCNKYDNSDAKNEDAVAKDAKTELEIYMFYYHRYESHRNARKIADKQRRDAEKKGQEIQQRFDVRATDTKFLLDATEQLLANRRTLEYSYVLGYYLDKSKEAEKNLFEFLQEDLEKHTNHLSELYEIPIAQLQDYHQFYQWKEEVTNYTRVTKKFLENFNEGVSQGLTILDDE